MNREKEVKIIIGKRVITRADIFRQKEVFHKTQAKMPFEEKISALVQLQKMSASLKRKKDIPVWKI